MRFAISWGLTLGWWTRGIEGVEGMSGKDPYSKAYALISFDRLGRIASTFGAISGVQRTIFAEEMLTQ